MLPVGRSRVLSCIDLIFGSKDPLPVSQYAPDRDDDTDGHIQITSVGKAKCPDEQAIFSTRYLYYIRTRHTSCACGFTGNYMEAENARRDLANFLERSLELVADLQLYVACDDFGDSGVVPSRIDCIGPNDICWMNGFTEHDLGLGKKVPRFFQVIRED